MTANEPVPVRIIELRAEQYAADERAVVISLRVKYSSSDRKYLVPLDCLHDLILDLQRLNAAAAGDLDAAPELPLVQPTDEQESSQNKAPPARADSA